MEEEKKFDPAKLFDGIEGYSKKQTVEHGVTVLKKIVFDIFDNNSLLSPEENVAIAQDMLVHGTGMSYSNLVKLWYDQWVKKAK